MFLLTEGEWGRVVLESGPILGLAFLVWRTLLTITLGLFSIKHLKRGEILPIMLYCAGFLSLLNGQFGQPTNLENVQAGGDIITAIDGQPIATFDELLGYLTTNKSPGESVVLTVLRGDQSMDVTVTLGARP